MKKLMITGAFIVIVFCLLALFAPWISPQDPNEMNLALRYQGPSLAHPFGLDENGGDVLAKVAYGARISLLVAFSVVFVGSLLGLLIGSVAGIFGGWWDQVIMRAIDIIYSFPSFLLALGLIAVMGPSVKNLIFVMCITSWTSFARLVRGEVLHLKEKEHVLSAKSLGASLSRRLIFHIWPELAGVLFINASFTMSATIIAESGLSFLGLGAPATTPTWGALLSSGRKILFEAPHVSLFPGMAILLLVLGFNLFGDGLRDYLDPRKAQ